MFTIEHAFDSTVITLVDEGADLPILDDVVINAFEDCVTIEQVDPRTDEVVRITLSNGQLRDLARVMAVAPQQMRQADDGIHRRANLVTHVGKKFALASAGSFGGLLGKLEFGFGTIAFGYVTRLGEKSGNRTGIVAQYATGKCHHAALAAGNRGGTLFNHQILA